MPAPSARYRVTVVARAVRARRSPPRSPATASPVIDLTGHPIHPTRLSTTCRPAATSMGWESGNSADAGMRPRSPLDATLLALMDALPAQPGPGAGSRGLVPGRETSGVPAECLPWAFWRIAHILPRASPASLIDYAICADHPGAAAAPVTREVAVIFRCCRRRSTRCGYLGCRLPAPPARRRPGTGWPRSETAASSPSRDHVGLTGRRGRARVGGRSLRRRRAWLLTTARLKPSWLPGRPRRWPACSRPRPRWAAVWWPIVRRFWR